MTLQLNEMGLFIEGFSIVSSYKKFEKDILGNWTCHSAVCYQKGNECVIKLNDSSSKYSGYTLYYESKEDANNKIKHLISMGYRKEKNE